MGITFVGPNPETHHSVVLLHCCKEAIDNYGIYLGAFKTWTKQTKPVIWLVLATVSGCLPYSVYITDQPFVIMSQVLSLYWMCVICRCVRFYSRAATNGFFNIVIFLAWQQ